MIDSDSRDMQIKVGANRSTSLHCASLDSAIYITLQKYKYSL
jgi:hypothetical protein